MGRKPAPKPDDDAQWKRFVELAEEVGADTDDAALERAFKKIVSQPLKSRKTAHKNAHRVDNVERLRLTVGRGRKTG